jgi:Metallo-beta-lactamase superfamily
MGKDYYKRGIIPLILDPISRRMLPFLTVFVRPKAYIQNKLPLGSRIDLAVASHPHADHVGSMLWVLRNYRVGTYIDNGVQYDSATYRKLKAELQAQIRQRQLRYFSHDQAALEDQDFCRARNLNSKVLVPSRGYQRQLCDRNPNNCSVIVRMTYEAVSFLFPGDAEEEQEEILLEHPALKESLSANVLKVSHHGSDTSSSRAFLDAVSPEWMVISAGKKNVGTNKSFMHPRLATINNLMTFAGAHNNPRYVDVYDSARKVWARKSIWGNLFLTGKDGQVVLSSNGSEIRKQ